MNESIFNQSTIESLHGATSYRSLPVVILIRTTSVPDCSLSQEFTKVVFVRSAGAK